MITKKSKKYWNLRLNETKKRRIFILVNWYAVKHLSLLIYYSEYRRRIYPKELLESNQAYVVLAISENLPESIISLKILKMQK